MQGVLEPPVFAPFAGLWTGVWPQNPAGFREILEACKLGIEPGADDMLDQPEFTMVKTTSQLPLVEVNIRDLMVLEHRVNRFLVYDVLQQFGLGLCPPEIGPRLRIWTSKAPGNWCLHVCMQGIPCSDGHRRAFLVENAASGPALGSEFCSPDSFFTADDRLICCQAV